MASYNEYPQTIHSNVDWLGCIPAHWKVVCIKHITPVKRGASPRPIDDPKYFDDDGEFAWVRIADVSASDRYLKNTTQRLSDIGEQLSVKRFPGDLFLSIAGSVGKPIITKIKCCIHDGFVYFPDYKENISFLFYLFDSGQPYLGLGKMGTQLNLNTDTVGSIKVGLPPLDEQVNIVKFLDHKTAQIDALIAKKQSLLDKLTEQRTALISQAVTKGLDPSVPMRDSGVEWLGEIPKHWTVPILGYVAEVRGGVTKGRKLPNEATVEVPYLRVANVQDGFIDLSHVTNIEILVTELERYSLQKGDVLMNEGGDNDKLGRGAVWEGEISPCLHQNHVFAVRPRIPEFSDWLALLTQSGYAKFYFYTTAKQSTNLASISSSNIKKLPVFLPPEAERREIIDHVKTSLDKLTKQRERVIQVIERLKEYRSALITNAVTGKIDVRDFCIPTTTEQREVAHG